MGANRRTVLRVFSLASDCVTSYLRLGPSHVSRAGGAPATARGRSASTCDAPNAGKPCCPSSTWSSDVWSQRSGRLLHAPTVLSTSTRLLLSTRHPFPFSTTAVVPVRREFCRPASDGDPTANAWPPKPVHWIERAVPLGLLPYVHLARLHKPVGTWLLAWPCFWSIALAAPPGALPDLYITALFGAGALLLRGAGCTINDMWDRDIDARVERTKYRPLAARVVDLTQATAFLAAQLSLGLVILLQLNDYSKVLGASSLLLVVTYPLMKRVTWWPQAFLGLTFNWGALLGWAAVRGSCDWAVVAPLYLSGVAWTLTYDTIYAYMDKRDDARAGVKSTALLLARNQRSAKLVLAGFAMSAASLQLASGFAAGSGPIYVTGVAAATSHLLWQARSVDLDDPKDCLAKFQSNVTYGGLLTAGIVLDRLAGDDGAAACSQAAAWLSSVAA